MAETTMSTPFGAVELHRGSTSSRSPLRAWSAADLAVLRAIEAEVPISVLGRLLIVNDAWGALSVPLAAAEPDAWTDSALARRAIDENLARNGLARLGDRAIRGDEQPTGSYDTVLLAVPKSHALLGYQSALLASCIGADSRVTAFAMSTHLSPGVYEHLGALGDVRPRRADGKARLIDIVPHTTGGEAAAPAASHAFDTDDGVRVFEAPGVFSAGHVDVGTALLLDTLAPADPLEVGGGALEPRCLDLGCGNGVVGVTLARRWPSTSWILSDVSDLAVMAARATRDASRVSADRVAVEAADGAAAFGDDAFDIVVSNPPFHQGHATDTELTERVLAEAAAALTDAGTLLVVAQRHRKVHEMLRRYFDQVEAISRHPSHVVICARQPRRARSASQRNH